MFFSLIICTKNSEKLVYDNIRSVKKQTFKDFEVVFVDGCSNDKTIKIIENCKIKFKRIIKNSLGIYKSFNLGIENAKGKYIIILNSDDIFLNKNVLKKIYNILKIKKSDVLFSNIKIFDQKMKKILRIWRVKKILNINDLIINPLPHVGMIVRKKIYQKYGFYSLRYKLSSDQHFILKR